MAEPASHAAAPHADPPGAVPGHLSVCGRLDAHRTRGDAAAAVTAMAVAAVPGAEWASLTYIRNGLLQTVHATDPEAKAVETIQYELGAGPSVEAILRAGTVGTDDLRVDPRWPDLGRAAAATRVRSVLSFCLFDTEGLHTGLSLYARRRSAFDDASKGVGTVVAAHGAVVVLAAIARERAAQLEGALATNRDIGVAMGVLMATYKITREQAFSLMQVASQRSNRKVREIAIDVADTGVLPLPSPRARRRSTVRTRSGRAGGT